MFPRLRDGVTCSTVSFNMVKIQENIKNESKDKLSRQKTHLVYDATTGELFSITQSAKEILELCNGKTSVHHIASKMAKKYSISVHNAEVGSIAFLKEMVTRGIVLV